MSNNDSSKRRAPSSAADANASGDTPIAFYFMMGAIVLALLYFLVAFLIA